MEPVSAAQKASAVIFYIGWHTVYVKLLKLKAVMLMGKVYPQLFEEVLKIMLGRIITYSMRCMAIGIAVAIFLLSAQSKLPIPENVSFHGLDKLLHACAFGSLAFTLSYWFPLEKYSKKPLEYFLCVCCVVAVYGITDEIHQLFVPGRDASVYDWFADCAGAVLATFLRLGIVRYTEKKCREFLSYT